MTTLIGTRWKRSNACSRGVLIRRSELSKGIVRVAYAFFLFMSGNITSRLCFRPPRGGALRYNGRSVIRRSGRDGLSAPCWCFVGGGTPVLIPNTAVKPSRADGTRKGRVGRRQHRVLNQLKRRICGVLDCHYRCPISIKIGNLSFKIIGISIVSTQFLHSFERRHFKVIVQFTLKQRNTERTGVRFKIGFHRGLKLRLVCVGVILETLPRSLLRGQRGKVYVC